MKVLNKRQAIILIVLNSAAVIMAAVLIFGGIFKNNTVGGDPLPTWIVERAPRASLNEHVVWETNIGGSGDETLIAAYRAGDKLVALGNTQSPDYDFSQGEGERGFLATLTLAGRIESIVTFEAISAVTLHEKGYVAALKAETGVILIGRDGSIVKRTAFGGLFPGSIVDLKMLSKGYAAIVQSQAQASKKELKVVRLDTELNVTQSVSLSRSASLEYLDLYEIGSDLLLAANFVSDIVNCLTFVEVSPTPVYHEVTAEFEYRVLSVVPQKKGYAALIVDLGTGFGNVLEIGADFAKKSLRYLNAAKPASGKLIASGNYTYAYVHLGADVSTLAVFDANLEYQNVLSDATTLTGLDFVYASASGEVTFFGRTDQGISVFSAAGTASRNNFMLEAPVANLRTVKTDSGLIVAGTATGKGGDCGANQGGADVWISSIR